MFSYSTGYYVSPPDDQYLKFKNRFSLVHKHEIILSFFWPKSNPYMPFINFWKKFRFFSFDFRQNFDVRWQSICGTKFFWQAIQKNFFLKIFTLVLLDGLLDGFWKFDYL